MTTRDASVTEVVNGRVLLVKVQDGLISNCAPAQNASGEISSCSLKNKNLVHTESAYQRRLLAQRNAVGLKVIALKSKSEQSVPLSEEPEIRVFEPPPKVSSLCITLDGDDELSPPSPKPLIDLLRQETKSILICCVKKANVKKLFVSKLFLQTPGAAESVDGLIGSNQMKATAAGITAAASLVKTLRTIASPAPAKQASNTPHPTVVSYVHVCLPFAFTASQNGIIQVYDLENAETKKVLDCNYPITWMHAIQSSKVDKTLQSVTLFTGSRDCHVR